MECCLTAGNGRQRLEIVFDFLKCAVIAQENSFPQKQQMQSETFSLSLYTLEIHYKDFQAWVIHIFILVCLKRGIERSLKCTALRCSSTKMCKRFWNNDRKYFDRKYFARTHLHKVEKLQASRRRVIKSN